MQPSENTWRAIDADGSARTVGEGESRRARVMALWAEGMDTFTIGELLGLPEHEICRILRDARDLRRQDVERPA